MAVDLHHCKTFEFLLRRCPVLTQVYVIGLYDQSLLIIIVIIVMLSSVNIVLQHYYTVKKNKNKAAIFYRQVKTDEIKKSFEKQSIETQWKNHYIYLTKT